MYLLSPKLASSPFCLLLAAPPRGVASTHLTCTGPQSPETLEEGSFCSDPSCGAVWSWATHSTSLSITSFLCKRGTLLGPAFYGYSLKQTKALAPSPAHTELSVNICRHSQPGTTNDSSFLGPNVLFQITWCFIRKHVRKAHPFFFIWEPRAHTSRVSSNTSFAQTFSCSCLSPTRRKAACWLPTVAAIY